MDIPKHDTSKLTPEQRIILLENNVSTLGDHIIELANLSQRSFDMITTLSGRIAEVRSSVPAKKTFWQKVGSSFIDGMLSGAFFVLLLYVLYLLKA